MEYKSNANKNATTTFIPGWSNLGVRNKPRTHCMHTHRKWLVNMLHRHQYPEPSNIAFIKTSLKINNKNEKYAPIVYVWLLVRYIANTTISHWPYGSMIFGIIVFIIFFLISSADKHDRKLAVYSYAKQRLLCSLFVSSIHCQTCFSIFCSISMEYCWF